MDTESAIVEVIVVPADALTPAFEGLEPSSARQLREAFVPALLQIEEWEKQAAELTVTDESQTAKMEMAGVMRKALKRVRVGVEKKRKELNADALARTRAINGAAAIVEGLIVPLESRLLEQETYGERAAAARKDALRSARAESLTAYGANPAAYADLGAMSEADWTPILDSARLAHEGRVEAARKAEEARAWAAKAEAEEREAARLEAIRREEERQAREKAAAEENARLRREAEEREKAAKIEAAKIEAERAAERAAAKAEADRVEAEARKEREAAESARRAEAARIEAERQAEREKAQAEAARIQAEADAKIAAEKAEREKVAKKALADRKALEAQLAAKDLEVAEARRAEIQKALADRAHVITGDVVLATSGKLKIAVAALHRIAALDDDAPDEPKAAARARITLVELGITGPATADSAEAAQ